MKHVYEQMAAEIPRDEEVIAQEIAAYMSAFWSWPSYLRLARDIKQTLINHGYRIVASEEPEVV
jgi:hypothetical protein